MAQTPQGHLPLTAAAPDRLSQLLGPAAQLLQPAKALLAATLLWIVLSLLTGRWLAVAWCCWSLVLLATALWLERPWVNRLPLPPLTVLTLAGFQRWGLGAFFLVAAGDRVRPDVLPWSRALEPSQALWGVLSTAVVAVASWDSSIHDSIYLNRLTEPSEQAYLIVKAVVRLSHPQHMDLMLRKRICFNVYKQQRSSLSDRIRRRLAGVAAATVSAAGIGQGTVSSVGVTYELVAHVPTASEELEARESLAIMAASSSNNNAAQDLQALADGETFIEKYTRAAAAVEELLRLDKLRQQMAVRELLVRANKEACGGRGGCFDEVSSGRHRFIVFVLFKLGWLLKLMNFF